MVEDRLTEHGAGKVVPDHTVLAEMWRRAVARQHVAVLSLVSVPRSRLYAQFLV